MDLVIQSPDLPGAAVDAFAAACLAPRTERRGQAARLFEVPDDADTRTIVKALAGYWKCDAAFVTARLRCSAYRALVMDMDSTLITIECIDELAQLAGKGSEVAAITAAAMRGELRDYSDSLRQRVALLAGAPASLIERVLGERLRLSPGAAALLAAARRHGWRTLLVSGGFAVFAERVQQDLGIDASWANALVVQDDRLTGEVLGPAQNGGAIVDADAKARALRETCAALGCDARQAIAVGDGANDLAMMAAAGFSVAYHAKPVVQQRASCALDYSGLDGILNLFADGW